MAIDIGVQLNQLQDGRPPVNATVSFTQSFSQF
jgi:hypothetical protein